MMRSQMGSHVRLQRDDHRNKKQIISHVSCCFKPSQPRGIRVKNTQKLTKFVCVCVFYSANSVTYEKNCNHDQFTKNVLPKFQIIPEPNTVKLVHRNLQRLG